jgi:hypothetical protein
MKTIYRKAIPLCLLIVVMFMIVGIAAAGDQPILIHPQQLPIANFIIGWQNLVTDQSPLTIQVTDKSSNADSVYFNFGDGSAWGPCPVGTSITHTYAKPGSYTITDSAYSTIHYGSYYNICENCSTQIVSVPEGLIGVLSGPIQT